MNPHRTRTFGLAKLVELPLSRAPFTPRPVRPHLADEYEAKGDKDTAKELRRHLIGRR